MKSLSTENQLQKIPAEILKELQTVCENSPSPLNVEATLNRWIQLLQVKKFHLPIAERSLKYHTEAIEAYRHNEIEEVLDEELCTIESSGLYQGPERTQTWIAILINEAFGRIQAGKVIKQELIMEMAGWIALEYKYLTIADIKLALKRGTIGKYGEIYDRLDFPTVFGWINKYQEERLAISESRRRTKAIEDEKTEQAIPMPEEIKILLAKLIEENKKAALTDKTDIGPIYTIEQYCHRHNRDPQDVEMELQGYLDKGWMDSGPYFEDIGLTKDQFEAIQRKQFLNNIKIN